MWNKASYYGMIEIIDRNVGRLLSALEEMSLRDDTLIIFTSDHGEGLGDHALSSKGCRFYEGLVRVPLIFSWPGRFKEDLRSDALVELLDMTPSVLELAGLEVPDYVQGKSLLPILRGEVSPDYHRDFVRCEYFDALDAGLTRLSGPSGLEISKGMERGKFTPSPGVFATMYRDRRYKLSIYHGHNLGELYDLQEDPWEFDNLWDDPKHRTIRDDLIYASFDAHVLITTDVGSRRIAPM